MLVARKSLHHRRNEEPKQAAAVSCHQIQEANVQILAALTPMEEVGVHSHAPGRGRDPIR